MRLGNDLMCRKYCTEEENSVHILCECEALNSLRYTYLGSFFLDLEDIKKLGVEAYFLNIVQVQKQGTQVGTLEWGQGLTLT